MGAAKGNKNALGNRGGRGQPSTYKPAYALQVRRAMEVGFTEAEVCDLFGISTSTFYSWRLKYPDFRDGVELGRKDANDRVARSLYQRAVGFEKEAVKLFQFEGGIVEGRYKEYFPPDVKAGIHWLSLRDPENWAQKQQMVVEQKIEHKFTLDIFDHRGNLEEEVVNDEREDAARKAIDVTPTVIIERVRKKK